MLILYFHTLMTIGSKLAARTEDAHSAAAATILVANPTLFILIVRVARWVTERFDQWRGETNNEWRTTLVNEVP